MVMLVSITEAWQEHSSARTLRNSNLPSFSIMSPWGNLSGLRITYFHFGFIGSQVINDARLGTTNSSTYVGQSVL